jgi:hypothetical protein
MDWRRSDPSFTRHGPQLQRRARAARAHTAVPRRRPRSQRVPRYSVSVLATAVPRRRRAQHAGALARRPRDREHTGRSAHPIVDQFGVCPGPGVGLTRLVRSPVDSRLQLVRPPPIHPLLGCSWLSVPSLLAGALTRSSRIWEALKEAHFLVRYAPVGGAEHGLLPGLAPDGPVPTGRAGPSPLDSTRLRRQSGTGSTPGCSWQSLPSLARLRIAPCLFLGLVLQPTRRASIAVTRPRRQSGKGLKEAELAATWNQLVPARRV